MSGTSGRKEEMAGKIALIRAHAEGGGMRLRGTDWFAWATAGGSSVVLLAAETGVAELVVSSSGAWLVTDTIEAGRMEEEEIPPGVQVLAYPWQHPRERETLVNGLIGNLQVFSDRPRQGEESLPASLLREKRTISPGAELLRYQETGMLAAQAMTETLREAGPNWTELELAGAGAGALTKRGLDPALVMAAGSRRIQLYRHPMPGNERLGSAAMLVFCARGRGLYANLTRFVSFGRLPPELARLHREVQEVEAEALGMSRPGKTLGEIYSVLAKAYAAGGYPDEIHRHHQGGTTGYLSREVLAAPGSSEELRAGSAVAWNPSLPGAKVEDTFVVSDTGLENLTLDPEWPSLSVNGVERPQVLER